MKVGFICVTHNSYDKLSKCLNSIYTNSKTDYHLYLIDNNSTDETLNLYKANLQRTTIIRNNSNLWWCGGINQGLQLTTDCDYIFMLNDDIEVPYNWDINHISILECNPKLGAIGALNSNNRDWQGYDNVRFKRNLPELGHIDRQDITSMNIELMKLNRAPELTGGMLAFFCTCFPRKVIDDVGMLDTRFIMGADDDDYARRLQAKGYYLGLLLNTYILHHAGYSINKKGSDFSQKCKQWNIALLKSKYPDFYGKPSAEELEILKNNDNGIFNL
jgi:GT2 family glycosyltransferase